LSKKAEVNTKPSLEIYADDVECSHGATAGNMDNNMLFYLQSRGINEDEATSMLIRGFAQEIIEEFDDENIINFLGNILNNKIKKLDIEGII
jgi:Fe-S cluster assembly protein SufD